MLFKLSMLSIRLCAKPPAETDVVRAPLMHECVLESAITPRAWGSSPIFCVAVPS